MEEDALDGRDVTAVTGTAAGHGPVLCSSSHSRHSVIFSTRSHIMVILIHLCSKAHSSLFPKH